MSKSAEQGARGQQKPTIDLKKDCQAGTHQREWGLIRPQQESKTTIEQVEFLRQTCFFRSLLVKTQNPANHLPFNLFYQFRRHASRHPICWYGLSYHSPCGDYRSVADGNPLQNDAVCTNPNI
jgi:hypothetical protein